MAKKKDGVNRRRWRKRLGKGLQPLVWVVLALCAVVGLSLLTGVPQRRILESAASDALGARVEAQGVSVSGRFQVAELAIRDSAAESPVMTVTGLDVDYALFPGDDRWLRSLAADEVSIAIRQSEAGQRNYDFVLALLDAEDAPWPFDPLRIVPRDSRVKSLTIRADGPGTESYVSGIGVEARVDALDRLVVEVSGDDVFGRWLASGWSDAQTLEHGSMTVRVECGPGSLDVRPFEIDLPGFLDVDGQIKVGYRGERAEVDVDLRRFVAVGDKLTGVLDQFARARGCSPLSVRFGRLDLSDTRLRGTLVDGNASVAGSKLRVDIHALRVGPEGHAYYDDDLTVVGGFASEGPLRGDFDIALGEGRQLQVAVERSGEAAKLEVTLADWSREAVTTLVPADFQDYLDWLPVFERVSAQGRFQWQEPRLEVDLGVRFALADDESLRLQLTGDACVDGATDTVKGDLLALAAGDVLRGTLNDWSLVMTPFTLRADAAFSGDVGDIGEMLGVSSMGGTVEVRAPLDVKNGILEAPVTLSVAALEVPGLSGPLDEPLSVAGIVTYDFGAGRAYGTALDIGLAGLANVALSDWSVLAAPLAADAGFTCQSDLEGLASLLGLGDLWGEAEATGALSLAEDSFRARVEVQTENLGYGDLVLPYGTTLTARTHVHYGLTGGDLLLDDLEIQAGTGTTLACGPVTLTQQPLEAEWTLHTDLALLAEMGVLDEVDGGDARAAGTTRYGEAGLWTKVGIEASAHGLVLAGGIAGLGGVALRGQVTYDGDLDGTGDLTVAQAVASGVTVGNINSTLVFRGKDIEADNIAFELWKGRVSMDVSVGLLQEDLPLQGSATLRGLDLAVFTEEFEPPEVTLTGLANGKADIEWAGGALSRMHVALESTKGFTMNREMVEQILMSSYTGGATGGKALGKITADIIGAADQRPFDCAELTLELKDERLVGQAVLDSELLSLTVDLKLAPSAILEVLEIRQKAQLDNIGSISTKPAN